MFTFTMETFHLHRQHIGKRHLQRWHRPRPPWCSDLKIALHTTRFRGIYSLPPKTLLRWPRVPGMLQFFFQNVQHWHVKALSCSICRNIPKDKSKTKQKKQNKTKQKQKTKNKKNKQNNSNSNKLYCQVWEAIFTVIWYLVGGLYI